MRNIADHLQNCSLHEALCDCKLFSSLSPEEITELLHCLQPEIKLYPANAYLLHSGARVDSVGLILRGKALIIQEDYFGNRHILTTVLPGQLYAEVFAACPGVPSTVSVVAEEETEVMQLRVETILTTCPESCPSHSQVIANLLADIAEKCLLLNQKLTHISRRSTRQKLLSYLSDQALRQGAPDFTIPLNRQELADYLVVDRSAMSSELSRLVQEGVLEVKRNHFVLKKDVPN